MISFVLAEPLVLVLAGLLDSRAKAFIKCLVCCRLAKQVSILQIEIGWSDIHWLARGEGWAAGGSHV
jgi:hypothetical protein